MNKWLQVLVIFIVVLTYLHNLRELKSFKYWQLGPRGRFVALESDSILPRPATRKSAGIDIHLKETVTIQPNQVVQVRTGIACEMPAPLTFLLITVRSSVGIKKHIRLANGVGIIDADYFNNPDNKGNIILALHNYGTVPVTLLVGERVAQGILLTYHDSTTLSEEERVSGIGSTD